MNRAFGFKPAETCIQSIGFEAKISQQREENMYTLYNLFSALTSFDATTLLTAPVILFDTPSKILERFSIGLRCIQNIGNPVFGFLAGMNDPEHLDETVLYQENNSSFGREINIKNRAVVCMIRINQTVGFESGTPMPLQ